jgi:hypothetical protein
MRLQVITALFCAGAVLAAPLTEQRRQRRAARRAAARPRITQRPRNVTEGFKTDGDDDINVQYSSNWAGAVLIGNGYTRVSGSVTIPSAQVPAGGSSNEQYAASAWVGIDGDTCGTAILQTGVDTLIEDGEASFDAWYEWYPDYAYDFDDFEVGSGDTIAMTVVASSKAGGTATLTNSRTGQTVSHTFTGQGDNPLCEENAEWIVEDFSDGGGLVPFANFGTITFTGTQAVQDGAEVDSSGSSIFDINQNGKVLTDCSADGYTVRCSYL